MLQDVRFALRTLLHQKLVTFMVIGCLALVVGGNTTVFSIVRSYLLSPLPYEDVERLTFVWETRKSVGGAFGAVSGRSFDEFKARTGSFEQIEAQRSGFANLTGDGPPERLQVQYATPGLLPMVGGDVRMGRLFEQDDARPGRERVALLSHRMWSDRFGSQDDIVGQTIQLDKEAVEVIGVLSEDFEWINWQLDLWMPLVVDQGAVDYTDRTLSSLIAKMKVGTTPQVAQADLVGLVEDLQAADPESYREAGVVVRTFRAQIPGPTDVQLFSFVQGAGLFVLLIACANIANLLLARGQVRQRELAVRAALGAGKARILRQLVTENVVLGLVGGLAGTALALVGVRVMRLALAGNLPQSILPEMDVWVLGFSLGISAVAGVIFGLLPSVHALRGRLQGALREGASRGSVGSRRRWSSAFVVGEVSLALALLCGAGMMLHTFLDVQFGDNGFETDNLAGFSLNFPQSEYVDDPQLVQAEAAVLRELRALPGVSHAVSSTALPRGRNIPGATVEMPGMELGDAAPPRVSWLSVSPGYPAAMQIPLLRGRDFTTLDRAETAPVVLVDQRFVERFFPDEDPLGQRITLRDEEREIVGVVGSVRHRRIGVIDGPTATVYLPYAQNPTQTLSFLVRAEHDVEQAFDPAREAVWRVDSTLPVAGLMTIDDYIALQMRGIDVFSGIVGGFGVFALLLAALGVYGVLAYSVAQRRQEIGVRMAMGAHRSTVLRLILRQGFRLACLGFAVGLPLTYVVVRLVGGMLGQVSEAPVMMLPAIAAGLLAVTLLASFIPARRAATVAPTVALRAD